MNAIINNNATRISLIALPFLLLAACLMEPGKFTSTLDIRADRHFTYSYKGEIIGEDLDKFSKGLGNFSDKDEAASDGPEIDDSESEISSDASEETVANDAKMKTIATALEKEEGYRSVRYMGNNVFEIDYQISGTLDHSFVFPFNPDAQAMFPFLSIEVRKDGKVKFAAPAFGNNDKELSKAKSSSSRTEGTFTLTTDAEIISQNQEDGASKIPTGKKIIWTITPYTDPAPMAVLQLHPKPSQAAASK